MTNQPTSQAPDERLAPDQATIATLRRQRPLISPQAPVYNALIWLMVASPLVPVLLQAAIWNPVPRFVDVGGVESADPLSIFNPWFFLTVAVGFLVYAGTVVAAFFDCKKLRQAGVVRPFHWAWAILSLLVYVIGRSVIVPKVAGGRGRAPFRAVLGAWLLSFVISIAHLMFIVQSFPKLSGS